MCLAVTFHERFERFVVIERDSRKHRIAMSTTWATFAWLTIPHYHFDKIGAILFSKYV